MATETTIKLNEYGVRLCDTKDCEAVATYTFIWTDKWQCACREHAQGILNLGNVMGHDLPKVTMRPMTMDEMIPEENDHATDAGKRE